MLTIRTISFSLVLGSIFILLPTSAAVAQNDDKKVYIGVKGGVSLPNLVGGQEEEISRDYKSRLAFSIDAIAEFQVSKGFSLQTGVDYAPQGGKRNGIQPITSPLPGLPPLPQGAYYYANFKNTAKLDYVEIPFLAKYTWRRESKIQPYFNAGPYVGFLAKATTVTKGSSTIYIDRNGTPLLIPLTNQPLPPIPFDAETDVTDELNRFNFGIAGGGGLKFKAKRDYFFVDVRGSYGLTTIQKDTINNGNSHTGNLVISVGYAFRVK